MLNTASIAAIGFGLTAWCIAAERGWVSRPGWVNADSLGIDVGITLLSAENLRGGFVWCWFMRNPEIRRAMKLIGLLPTSARQAK